MSKDKNMGLFVKVNTDEEDQVVALDKALKKLKRKIKKSNIMIDLYNSYFYRKPSEIKREKKRKAISRNKRNIEMGIGI
jgi:ribosomal protein S21